MKLSNVILFLFIPLIGIHCTSQTSEVENAETQLRELKEAINTFNEAFKAGDLGIIKSMVTEDYIHTNGISKSIRKNDWFNYLEKRSKEIKDGKLIISKYEMVDSVIELHDNAAILTAKIIIESSKDGNFQQNEYRITNFWIKKNGSWKRAGFHDGKIK